MRNIARFWLCLAGLSPLWVCDAVKCNGLQHKSSCSHLCWFASGCLFWLTFLGVAGVVLSSPCYKFCRTHVTNSDFVPNQFSCLVCGPVCIVPCELATVVPGYHSLLTHYFWRKLNCGVRAATGVGCSFHLVAIKDSLADAVTALHHLRFPHGFCIDRPRNAT